MELRVFILASAILCIGEFVARADEAEDTVRQGVERRRQGDDQGALRLFEQAYEKGHSPRALAQMALAEQALGRWVVAFEHPNEALGVKGDRWIEKNRATLKDAAARVSDHIGWLEILGGQPGWEVRIDGVARGALPLPGRVASTTGAVTIDLVAAGRAPLRRTTTVRSGETTREAFNSLPLPSVEAPLALEGSGRTGARATNEGTQNPKVEAVAVEPQATPPVKPPAPSFEPPAADQPTHVRAPSMRVPLVIGAAALSAGALVFAIIEHRSWLNSVDAFDGMMECDPAVAGHGSMRCAAIYDDAHGARTLAFVGYAMAGALVATSAVLFFVLDRDQPANSQVACAVQPTLTGLGCQFRF